MQESQNSDTHLLVSDLSETGEIFHVPLYFPYFPYSFTWTWTFGLGVPFPTSLTCSQIPFLHTMQGFSVFLSAAYTTFIRKIKSEAIGGKAI